MPQQTVWSPQIRILHWTIALFTLLMFITAESGYMEIHVLIAPVLMAAVIVRIWIGFTGRPHERFSSFCPSFKKFINYINEMRRGRPRRTEGHNPLAGPVMLGIILLIVLNGLTGFAAGTAEKDALYLYELIHLPDPVTEAAEVIHSVLGHMIMFLVLLHIAGIIVHTIKYKEFIAKAMITGKKEVD